MRTIDSIPRVRLATLPTPLYEAKGLREALGGSRSCPTILLKRDDLTGLALGGNKVRKLEFLIADALDSKATVIITTGAVQSNHARMTAAAAVAVGLNVVLVLNRDGQERDASEAQGNLLLDRILGATIYVVDEGPSAESELAPTAMVSEIAAKLASEGERPYIIPLGGSNALGTLGYVEATRELLTQLDALGKCPTRVYFASGSRSTQAGLLAGLKLYDAPYQLCPIAVSFGGPEKLARTQKLATEAAALLDISIEISQEELQNDYQFVGSKYGEATPECIAAIYLMARSEGIFLDPVYTGKAFAGLVEHIRRGYFTPDETVMFLHTGGIPALFAHVRDFEG